MNTRLNVKELNEDASITLHVLKQFDIKLSNSIFKDCKVGQIIVELDCYDFAAFDLVEFLREIKTKVPGLYETIHCI